MRVGEKLRRIRRDKDLSQSEFYAPAGRKAPYASQLERGRINDVKVSVLVALCKAWDIPFAEFDEVECG